MIQRLPAGVVVLLAAAVVVGGSAVPGTVAASERLANSAPDLSEADVQLDAVEKDAPSPSGAGDGTPVSDLVDLESVSGGLDNVEDPDGDTPGIALTDTDSSSGTWWYYTGISWKKVSDFQGGAGVSDSNALLLRADDRLYFEPDPGFTGTVSSGITFRAWDHSNGEAGTSLDTTGTPGGTESYSATSDTASVRVNAPPTADAGRDKQVTEGTAPLDGSASTDDAGITSYEWDVGADGSIEATGPTPEYEFDSIGTYTVELTVTDGSGATDTDTITVDVIEPTPPDTTPPTVELDAPETALAGEEVGFSALAFDNRNYDWQLDYAWSFGDGTTTSGRERTSVSHTYDSAGNYTVELTVTDTSGNSATKTATVEVEPDGRVDIDRSIVSDERGDVVEFGLTLTNTNTATLSIGDLSDNNWVENLTVRDGNGDGRVTLEFNTYTAGARGYADRTYDTGNDADEVVAVRTVLAARESRPGLFTPDTPAEATLGATDYTVEAVAGDVDTLYGRSSDAVATLSLGQRTTDSMDTWVAPRDRPPRTLDGIQDLMAGGNLTRTETVAAAEYLVAAVGMNGVQGILKNGTDGPADNLTDAFMRETVDGLGNASLSSYTARDLPKPVRQAAFALAFDVTSAGSNANRTELVESQDALGLVADPDNATYYLVYDLGAQTKTSPGDDVRTTLTVLDHDDVGDNVSVSDTVTFESPSASVDADADTDGDGRTDEVTVEAAPGGTITGTATVAPGTDLTVRVRGTSVTSPFLKPLTARVRPDRTWTATGDFSDVAAGANFTVQVKRAGRDLLDTTVDGRVIPKPTASVTVEDQRVNGTNVTVASVTTSAGGFVAIHNGSAAGSVLGTSDSLEPGTRSDLSVRLDRVPAGDATLVAVVYRDVNEDAQFERSVDTPYVRNGSAVVDSATVDRPDQTSSVTFADQTTNGTSVVVDRVVSTHPGVHVVIHRANASGEVLGATPTILRYPDNATSDLRVALDEPLEANATLVAVVHGDNVGGDEFLDDDKKLVRNGAVVADSADITVTTSTAAVTFEDQRVNGTNVTVASVTTSGGGFVAIHNGSAAGDVLGVSEFLTAGTETDVDVELDRIPDGDVAFAAVVYGDADGDRAFDRSVDVPYEDNGIPVADSAAVNVTVEISAVTVDTNADVDDDGALDEVTVEAAPGATITGTADVASGTELTVWVTGTDPSSPFLKQLTARVDEDGTWTATGDFSTQAAGARFTVNVMRGGESLLAETVDGAIVNATGSPLPTVAARYDGNNDGEISIGELGDAATDYTTGTLPLGDLADVAAAYAENESDDGTDGDGGTVIPGTDVGEETDVGNGTDVGEETEMGEETDVGTTAFTETTDMFTTFVGALQSAGVPVFGTLNIGLSLLLGAYLKRRQGIDAGSAADGGDGSD